MDQSWTSSSWVLGLARNDRVRATRPGPGQLPASPASPPSSASPEPASPSLETPLPRPCPAVEGAGSLPASTPSGVHVRSASLDSCPSGLSCHSGQNCPNHAFKDRQLLGNVLRSGSAKRGNAVVNGTVRQLLSFDGCEDLLRGIGLNSMMSRQVEGLLPMYSFEGRDYPRSCFFGLILAPTFLVVIFFYRDVAGLFGPGPPVFLDKACIDQTDVRRQREGIHHLGAFLGHSRYMLVCFTPMYIRKLWTMYEVASFLSLQPTSRMQVIPHSVPRVFLLFLLAVWLHSVLRYPLETSLGGALSTQLALGIALVIMPFVMRRWVRMKVRILSELSTFTVRDASCAVESDRWYIYANIRHLMLAVLNLDEETSMEEALDLFDELVRSEVPAALLQSIGKYGLQYKYLVTVGWFLVWPAFLDYVAGIPHGFPVRWMFTYACWYISELFLAYPLCLILCYHWAYLFLHFKGIRDHAHCLVGYFLIVVPCVLGFPIPFDALELASQDSDLVLGLWSAGLLVAVPLVTAFITDSWPTRPTRHSAAFPESSAAPDQIFKTEETQEHCRGSHQMVSPPVVVTAAAAAAAAAAATAATAATAAPPLPEAAAFTANGPAAALPAMGVGAGAGAGPTVSTIAMPSPGALDPAETSTCTMSFALQVVDMLPLDGPGDAEDRDSFTI